MPIEYFTRQPGDVASQSESDPSMLLFNGGELVGELVRLPTEIDANRPSVKVLRKFIAPCPITKVTCPHYELEYLSNDKPLFVAESDKFYWYTNKK